MIRPAYKTQYPSVTKLWERYFTQQIALVFDFAGIPQSYAHLMISTYLRSNFATLADAVRLRFNGDTTSNYDAQRVVATGAAVSAGENIPQNHIPIGFAPGTSAAAGLFAASTIIIPNYASIRPNKCAIVSTAFKNGVATTNLQADEWGGYWRSGDPINRVTIDNGNGDFFTQGSRVAVYGLP